MVRTKKTNRLAFTMIELIFAIVVIAIAVMSLPVMTRITSKTIEDSLLQEAIFAASAELVGATSFYWDETSMADSDASHLSRVINIGSTCEPNAASIRYRLRPGHIAQPYHRRCLDDDNTTLGATGSVDYPSINSAAVTKPIFTGAAGQFAYKDNYTSTITVGLLADNNIKKISSTVSQSGTDIVKLHTYSANVGEVDYYKRRF